MIMAHVYPGEHGAWLENNYKLLATTQGRVTKIEEEYDGRQRIVVKNGYAIIILLADKVVLENYELNPNYLAWLDIEKVKGLSND